MNLHQSVLRWFIFLTSILCFPLFTISCKSKEKKCRYGKSEAIFDDKMPTVKKHFFQIKEGVGVEMVAFEKKLFVEIEQSGCDKALQQFTFILAGDFKDATDDDWKLLSIKFFDDFAKISPRLISFGFWAKAMHNIKDNIKLSESTRLEQEGYVRYVRIDKILSKEKATLVVQLSE
jgi:hypothetical protein